MTNSDLAHLPLEIIDGDVLDCRRRKTGRERRVLAMPPDVHARLKAYRRPTPADARYSGYCFLDGTGKPYDGPRQRSQSSTEFRHLMNDAGVYRKGRGFTGLRTTFFNAAVHASALTRGAVMGRRPEGMRSVDWDNYLEDVDVEPIRQLTTSVWDTFRNLLPDDKPLDVASLDADQQDRKRRSSPARPR